MLRSGARRCALPVLQLSDRESRTHSGNPPTHSDSRVILVPFGADVGTDEKANPSREGDAKPRGSSSQPSCRIGCPIWALAEAVPGCSAEQIRETAKMRTTGRRRAVVASAAVLAMVLVGVLTGMASSVAGKPAAVQSSASSVPVAPTTTTVPVAPTAGALPDARTTTTVPVAPTTTPVRVAPTPTPTSPPAPVPPAPAPPAPPPAPSGYGCAAALAYLQANANPEFRSEEHTSELQSLRHLV